MMKVNFISKNCDRENKKSCKRRRHSGKQTESTFNAENLNLIKDTKDEPEGIKTRWQQLKESILQRERKITRMNKKKLPKKLWITEATANRIKERPK